MTSVVTVKCQRCKDEFEARVADRKRGWGKFCSKRCKAIKQTYGSQSFIPTSAIERLCPSNSAIDQFVRGETIHTNRPFAEAGDWSDYEGDAR